MNEADSRSNGDNHENPEFQRLVAMYVDRLIGGDRIEPLEIVASHPDCGERILQELTTFTQLGVGKFDVEPLGTLGDYTLRRQIGRGAAMRSLWPRYGGSTTCSAYSALT